MDADPEKPLGVAADKGAALLTAAVVVVVAVAAAVEWDTSS